MSKVRQPDPESTQSTKWNSGCPKQAWRAFPLGPVTKKETNMLPCFYPQQRRHTTELVNLLSPWCCTFTRANRSEREKKLWPVALKFTCSHQSLMWVIMLTLCKTVLRGASHTAPLFPEQLLATVNDLGPSSTDHKPNEIKGIAEISGRVRWQQFEHSCHMILVWGFFKLSKCFDSSVLGWIPWGITFPNKLTASELSLCRSLYLRDPLICDVPFLVAQHMGRPYWCNFTEVMMSNTYQLYGWLQECSHTLSNNQGIPGLYFKQQHGQYSILCAEFYFPKSKIIGGKTSRNVIKSEYNWGLFCAVDK